MADIEGRIPLVDRVNELAELKSQLSSAAKGSGNMLFISGEAGVGKTRLLSELIDRG